MPYRTLITVDQLQALQRAGQPVLLLDCSFDLADPSAGERAYAEGHLPGAHYLHLERELSAPAVRDAQGRFPGRHPLPGREALAALLGRLGLRPGVQAVAYDAQGGMFAARAWWLLRWLGHDAVAVLDGGRQAWAEAGGVLDPAVPARDAAAAPYPVGASTMPTLDATALLSQLGRVRILDARAPERYRGETEPLDAVAGHIPGALNRFFKLNLQPDGRFKSAQALRAELAPLLAGGDPARLVQQCGSGVTACHNLLAFEHAGLGGSPLYPGSWSEWCSDPARPVARS
ncbi:sulfurtransferase [Azohydromonas caseinilytica]|uniref:Sulfurtransferase n=1 Tax=Azohydromonas caseinilytica TaxID=2728836 RepID=A0A848F7F1_9BURK|nr:sulfurtransferase [Azohydromonas caseinilytica]NML13991.1 sulfurtransferase [Azohydromonas caseinilytica]